MNDTKAGITRAKKLLKTKYLVHYLLQNQLFNYIYLYLNSI